MRKSPKRTLLSILSICLIVLLNVLPVKYSMAEGEAVFSGTGAAAVDEGAYTKIFDLMENVSASVNGETKEVRVKNVSSVQPVGTILANTASNNIQDNIAVTNNELTWTTESEGTVFLVTYEAYDSAYPGVSLGETIRRIVVRGPDTIDEPYMYAVTPQNVFGAIGVAGSTITYNLFLYNYSFAATYVVSIPLPEHTSFVSGTGGLVSADGMLTSSVSVAAGETKELQFTLQIDNNATGAIIDCRASYAFDFDPTSPLRGNLVRTMVEGTVPAEKYALTYDANGGENPPEDTGGPYEEGEIVQLLSQGNMTYAGHVFLGWSPLSTASQPLYKYADLEAGTVAYPMRDEPVTMYAIWRTITNVPTFIEVSVEWSNFEFTYSGEQTWDPETHQYSGGTWAPDSEGGNIVRVKNEGASDVTVSYGYEKTITEVSGTFYNDREGTSAVSAPVPLPINRTSQAFLMLDGTPNGSLSNETLGTVTVTIGLPNW